MNGLRNSVVALDKLPQFADGEKIAIKPLTILCGRNGSGVASAFQYISELLVKNNDVTLKEENRWNICCPEHQDNDYKINFDKPVNNYTECKKKWSEYFSLIELFDEERSTSYSRVDTILTECIESEKNNVLIFNCPEERLYPDLQMKVADLLLATAISGRTVVVQTNSDHIMNRVSRRVMETYGTERDISDLVKIYFVSKDKNGISNIYTGINIDSFKGLVNCPEEFFDQYGYELRAIMKQGFENYKVNNPNH